MCKAVSLFYQAQSLLVKFGSSVKQLQPAPVATHSQQRQSELDTNKAYCSLVICTLSPVTYKITGDYWRLLEITGDY